MNSYNYEDYWESLDYSAYKLSAEELHEVLLERFYWDFSDKIAAAIEKYFSGELPSSLMSWTKQFDKDTIELLSEGDQAYVDYSDDIYSVISACISELETYQIPENRKMYHQKVAWPVYDDRAINSYIDEYIENFPDDLTNEEKIKIRKEITENLIVEEYVTQFEQQVYQDLKELAVLHFPLIMNISGIGYRELDFLLFDYAKDIVEETLRIIPLEIKRYNYPAFGR